VLPPSFLVDVGHDPGEIRRAVQDLRALPGVKQVIERPSESGIVEQAVNRSRDGDDPRREPDCPTGGESIR
jgi:hypothetical protein